MAPRSLATKEGYLIYFIKFCNFVGFTPNQLIEKAKEPKNNLDDLGGGLFLETKVS